MAATCLNRGQCRDAGSRLSVRCLIFDEVVAGHRRGRGMRQAVLANHFEAKAIAMHIG